MTDHVYDRETVISFFLNQESIAHVTIYESHGGLKVTLIFLTIHDTLSTIFKMFKQQFISFPPIIGQRARTNILLFIVEVLFRHQIQWSKRYLNTLFDHLCAECDSI